MGTVMKMIVMKVDIGIVMMAGQEIVMKAAIEIVMKANTEMRIEVVLEETEIGVPGMMKDMEEAVIHTTETEIDLVETQMNIMEEIVIEIMTTGDGAMMAISLVQEVGAWIEIETVTLKRMTVHLGMHNLSHHFHSWLSI